MSPLSLGSTSSLDSTSLANFGPLPHTATSAPTDYYSHFPWARQFTLRPSSTTACSEAAVATNCLKAICSSRREGAELRGNVQRHILTQASNNNMKKKTSEKCFHTGIFGSKNYIYIYYITDNILNSAEVLHIPEVGQKGLSSELLFVQRQQMLQAFGIAMDMKVAVLSGSRSLCFAKSGLFLVAHVALSRFVTDLLSPLVGLRVGQEFSITDTLQHCSEARHHQICIQQTCTTIKMNPSRCSKQPSTWPHGPPWPPMAPVTTLDEPPRSHFGHRWDQDVQNQNGHPTGELVVHEDAPKGDKEPSIQETSQLWSKKCFSGHEDHL